MSVKKEQRGSSIYLIKHSTKSMKQIISYSCCQPRLLVIYKNNLFRRDISLSNKLIFKDQFLLRKCHFITMDMQEMQACKKVQFCPLKQQLLFSFSHCMYNFHTFFKTSLYCKLKKQHNVIWKWNISLNIYDISNLKLVFIQKKSHLFILISDNLKY